MLIMYYAANSVVAQSPDQKNSASADVFFGNNQKSDKEELMLYKSFKGETIETTKKVTVTAGYSLLSIELHGHVKSGKINLTLYKPNKEILKYLEIDATSDVTFEKKLSLTENSGYIGDWQIKIQTEKADGSYNLEISLRN